MRFSREEVYRKVETDREKSVTFIEKTGEKSEKREGVELRTDAQSGTPKTLEIRHVLEDVQNKKESWRTLSSEIRDCEVVLRDYPVAREERTSLLRSAFWVGRNKRKQIVYTLTF